ncbi:LysR substrate-binding domain-containing protein [Geomicrobium sp. JCM 19055]|uniref:LysR substrate-binding domain-containing protein n=1 Tax=Geomicrobium sp. JCM 19055 TaxID=1460649 RepID=UPI000694B69F|nr:LysR substrate-binding domain-containing protein [Geomicrobium sp. JCM 19055]
MIYGKKNFFLTVSNHHKLTSSPEVSIEELANEEFVILKQGYGIRSITDKIFEELPFKPKISFEGEEIDTIAGLISSNLGISFLPKLEGNKYIKQIDLPSLHYKRVVGVIYNQTDLVSPISQKFLNEIIRTFRSEEQL